MVPRVQTDQAAAQALLARKAELSAFTCTKRECRFDVVFAAGGAFQARLVVSRAVRRKLGLGTRLVSEGAKGFAGPAEDTERLPIGGDVRSGLRAAGLRSVKAKLFVSALTASGLRTDIVKRVRLRR
jgi:hypothetical protein